MNVLVIDIGGTNVKVWRTGEGDKQKIPSGKELTPEAMVDEVKRLLDESWKFDRVSIGYPGHVLNGHPSAEPYNLGPGWVDFDYSGAFGAPTRIMNDAAMQALGSYEGGSMLYLGLGTSMGTVLIVDKHIIPLALGHLRFHKGESFEHFLSRAGLERYGVKGWVRSVADAAATLKAAFLVDYVMLGGGNSKKLKELPEGCRRGGNHNAYHGGLRMWDEETPAAVVTDNAMPAVVNGFSVVGEGTEESAATASPPSSPEESSTARPLARAGTPK